MELVRNNAVEKSRRRTILAAVLIAATLILGILIGTIVNGRVSAMRAFTFSGTTAAPLALPDPIPSSNSFSTIVGRVGPAVVNIATTQVMDRKSARKHRGQGDQDDPSEDFFFHFFDGKPDSGQPQTERSLGSGVIVDKQGYILTNNHVVDQATKVQVMIAGDTTKYTAKVIGVDEATDLAVIKIDAGQRASFRKIGQLRRRAGGRLGAGHRQPLRIECHRHRRNYQRQRPQRNRAAIPALPADRRRD